MSQQLEELVARARAVAETWSRLKAIAAKQQPSPVVQTLNMTVALDELVHAVGQWTLATNPTERVEPLADLTPVRITCAPHMGLTGVVVMQHTLAVYEVEVLDGVGASLGTFAIERQYLEPIVVDSTVHPDLSMARRG